MRLWTLHPRYLDTAGLLAAWREALLARAVLRGRTRGYRHHPQLARFRTHARPCSAINAYLAALHEEACRRGYRFERRRIGPLREIERIGVTTGQVAHEWRHLLRKLKSRSPALYRRWRHLRLPRCHPLFRPCRGPVEAWERGAGAAPQARPARRG